MISSDVTSSSEVLVRKFVKIGESSADLQFAFHCSEFRSSLNLPSISTTVATLKITGDIDYGNVAALGKGGEKWREGVDSKIAQIVKIRDSKAETLLVDVFDNGVRLSDVNGDSIYWHDDFGLELVKVLLFRKFVGSKDTNAFNLMCREVSGTAQILSCDENKASKESLFSSTMSGGLETAQKIRYDFKVKCAEAIVERTEEVGKFIEKMRGLWEERFKSQIGEGGRMDETHARLFRDWNKGKEKLEVCVKRLGVDKKDVVGRKKKRKVEVDIGESKRTKT